MRARARVCVYVCVRVCACVRACVCVCVHVYVSGEGGAHAENTGTSHTLKERHTVLDFPCSSVTDFHAKNTPRRFRTTR